MFNFRRKVHSLQTWKMSMFLPKHPSTRARAWLTSSTRVGARLTSRTVEGGGVVDVQCEGEGVVNVQHLGEGVVDIEHEGVVSELDIGIERSGGLQWRLN